MNKVSSQARAPPVLPQSNIALQYLALCLIVSSSLAAPAAEAEADPQFGFPGPLTVPAPNCVTSNEILVTQACTPRAENICETQVVETEEIEYEPLCKDVVDVICDGKKIVMMRDER